MKKKVHKLQICLMLICCLLIPGLSVQAGACLKNHSRHLNPPLSAVFAPNSGHIACYAPFIWHKSSINCGIHLSDSGETNIQLTDSGETNIQLTDSANLLTKEEAAEINQQLADLEKAAGWDIMAYTTEDAGGMDATAYAETFFDEYTARDDGVICGIDMDNREIVIRAFGEARYYITDERTEQILDAGYDGVSEEQYGEALKSMLGEVKRAFQGEDPRKNKLYDEDTGKTTSYRQEHRGISRLEFLIAGIAALAAGGITAGGIIGTYRFKSGSYQYPIEKNGTIRLERKEDRFVNQFVTHRHIPRESSGSSGGKSTVHTGAGGRSSSGGSRKF